MVPFAIGSEIVASMTLPATHCGVAALCATFGFVGRTCVMSLLESLVCNNHKIFNQVFLLKFEVVNNIFRTFFFVIWRVTELNRVIKFDFKFVYQDKLGPVCRSVADCVIVLDAIKGNDPDDLSSRDIPLRILYRWT